jgi:hypothetical protein
MRVDHHVDTGADRFFAMAGGHDLRFGPGEASLPLAPGLGIALDEAGARATPWLPMARPWLDPRLG